MKRLTNDLIGDVRTIEIASIDVIDTECYRLTENGNGGIHVTGRTKHSRSRELHCTVAQTIERDRSVWQHEVTA